MSNSLSVKDNLVNFIAKIGEKITIRRTDFLDDKMVKIIFMFTLQFKKIYLILFQSLIWSV